MWWDSVARGHARRWAAAGTIQLQPRGGARQAAVQRQGAPRAPEPATDSRGPRASPPARGTPDASAPPTRPAPRAPRPAAMRQQLVVAAAAAPMAAAAAVAAAAAACSTWMWSASRGRQRRWRQKRPTCGGCFRPRERLHVPVQSLVSFGAAAFGGASRLRQPCLRRAAAPARGLALLWSGAPPPAAGARARRARSRDARWRRKRPTCGGCLRPPERPSGRVGASHALDFAPSARACDAMLPRAANGAVGRVTWGAPMHNLKLESLKPPPRRLIVLSYTAGLEAQRPGRRACACGMQLRACFGGTCPLARAKGWGKSDLYIRGGPLRETRAAGTRPRLPRVACARAAHGRRTSARPKERVRELIQHFKTAALPRFPFWRAMGVHTYKGEGPLSPGSHGSNSTKNRAPFLPLPQVANASTHSLPAPDGCVDRRSNGADPQKCIAASRLDMRI